MIVTVVPSIACTSASFLALPVMKLSTVTGILGLILCDLLSENDWLISTHRNTNFLLSRNLKSRKYTEIERVLRRPEAP